MELYHFTKHCSVIKIIEENALIFSTPKKLNDPFDCNIDFNITEGLEIDKLNLFLLNYYKNCSLKTLKKLGYSSIRELISFRVTEIINNPFTHEKEIRSWFDELFKNMGVCSFTKNNKDILLWSHYADKHLGVCLKFESKNDQDFFKNPIPISYETSYPDYNFINNFDKARDILVGTKYKLWSYEEEIRLIKEININTNKFQFNKSALTDIFFGLNCSNESIKSIKELTDKKKYKNIKFHKAVKKSKYFAIDFKEIKDL